MAESRIPLVLCGKIPTHQKAVSEAIASEFDVIRICSTNEEVHQAIKDYFIDPNDASSAPRIFMMGGGYSQDDFNSAVAISPAIKPASPDCKVVWFRPAHFAPDAQDKPRPTEAPPADIVARRSREALWEQLDVLRSGEATGKVFYY